MNARLVLGTGLLSLVLTGFLPAAPPIEKLLPGTTREFLQIPSVATLEANWAKTQFGKIATDPSMKGFLDSLGVAGWLPGTVPARIELSPDDLAELSGAGAGWAFVYPVAGKGSQVVWIDTTGKSGARTKWVERVTARIKKMGGRLGEEKIGGENVTVYEIRQGSPVYALTREDLLILAESREVMAGIVSRWTSEADSLGQVPAFQAITKRLGNGPSNLRFYIDPIGRLEMMRANNPVPKGNKEKDLVATLRKQGVDGIKGIGACVRLATGTHDLLYHVVVHAPPPLRGGLSVLRLEAGNQFTPEAWVPAELASCATVCINLGAAFDAIGPIFDQVAPGAKEGTFKELVESLRDDPKGPRVDLRKDLIERLQPRVTLITPSPDPKDTKPDRGLTVIPVRDQEVVQKTLRRMFEGDDGAKRLTVLGQEIWVVESQAKKKPGEAQPPPSKTAFCTANGCFYLSSRPELIEAALRRGKNEPSLASTEDYKRVAAELDRLTPPGAKVAVRTFARTNQEYRDLYEAARLQKRPEAELNGWTLASVFVGRMLTGDMSKLPAFDKVAPFLGTSGMYGMINDDGWEIVGFNLPR
jgi:hypothetical protein